MKKLLLLLLFIPCFSFCQKKKTQTKIPVKKEIDYCSLIRKSISSYDSSLVYFCPEIEGVQLICSASKVDTTYYLKIRIPGNIKFNDAYGVELFMSGKNYEYKDKEIKIEANEGEGDMYLYSAIIKIKKYEELFDLLIKDLKIVKLYIYDKKLTLEASKALSQYALCLVNIGEHK